MLPRQVRALFQAAARIAKDGGQPKVEVMIPLVVTAPELAIVAGWVRETVEEVLTRSAPSSPSAPTTSRS